MLQTRRPLHDENPWVTWKGRTWLCKRKDETICEITGYQIAEALDIPLQPWAAFFHSASKGESMNCIGILIERWAEYERETPLWTPAEFEPAIVARALALGVLDRMEWPKWLIRRDELRLYDLEFIGPFLHSPPQQTPLRYYGEGTQAALDYARGIAERAGVRGIFETGLQTVVKLEFSRVLDFTGLPGGESMRGVILRGLEARQRRLRRLTCLAPPT
jgi:hypothetical protein